MTDLGESNAGFVPDEGAFDQGTSYEMSSVQKDQRETKDEKKIANNHDLMYSIDQNPPWHLSIVLGMQHYLTMFGSTVSIPFIICPALCIENDDPSRGYIISTILFVSGIVTLLQATFGVRLPIIQGGTFAFLAPTFAILNLERNKCPDDFARNGWNSLNLTHEEKTEEWQTRMREIQGAIVVASIFQLLFGYLGIVGALLKFITPLTIAPAVTMIGLALFSVAADLASKHWGISIGTIILMTIMSQYLRDVQVPFFAYSRDSGFRKTSVYLFKLFPVLFTILFMWGLCGILTACGVFAEDSPARTDLKLNLIAKSAWIRVPYPFQWGVPNVTLAGVFGMLAGVLASAIESVGDYYACARLSGAPPPPTHAINRGIGTEGFGCILAGLWGTGNGTTSYSENIGAIGVTKVGSRTVIQWAGLILILFGLLSKFGAAFITIPEPIVGGMFCVMFGMITAVGLSNLQFVNLNSSRNLYILGFSIFNGLMLPKWIAAHPDAIYTGSEILDQIIRVLLETSMFVSGFLGFILDNTIPGTPEERGLVQWQAQHEEHESRKDPSAKGPATYDLPIGMSFIKRLSWSKYVPFSPTYDEKLMSKKIAALFPWKRCKK